MNNMERREYWSNGVQKNERISIKKKKKLENLKRSDAIKFKYTGEGQLLQGRQPQEAGGGATPSNVSLRSFV
jgi:hypothetical protein